MSGDVQPRKRREKKKRKDDSEELSSHSHFARAATPPNNNDDLNIHIHKESTTGGGICAKFVFFILFAALAILIGLIITEHRGLTDLDTIEKETRFGQYFEGWVDTAVDDHDDHHISHGHDEHEHEDEDDDHHLDDHDEDEDDHDEHDEDDDHSEQDEEDDDHDEKGSEEEEPIASEEEEEEDDDDDDESKEESAQDDEDQDDVSVSAQVDDRSEEADEDEDDTKEESAQDDDDDDTKEESAQDDDDDEDNKTKEDDEDDDEDNEDDVSSQLVDEIDDSRIQDNDDDDDDDDDNQSVEDNEKEIDDASAEQVEAMKSSEKQDEDDDGEQKEGADMISVLLTNEVTEKLIKKEESLDLSRRNTIIVPPKVEEVEQIVDIDDEEYSDEEVEVERVLPPQIKQDYMELRTTYQRSLTPESDDYEGKSEEDEEDDEEEAELEENEEQPDDGEYDEEVEDEEVEEAVEEEEEELDEEEDEEEIDDPVSDDDEELMKKLEARYGKLQGNEEEEEEDEDDEEYDEEDVDGHYSWKNDKTNAPQAQSSDDERDSWLSGGAQAAYDFENITNANDYEIRDALDNAQNQIDNNAALALSLFNKIIIKYPKSSRALYGKAKSLDKLAEQKRSNEILKKAISQYLDVLKLDATPLTLIEIIGERVINRMRFIGSYLQAIDVHKLLIEKFPRQIKYRNQLAVTYLTINRISEARQLLLETLKLWPNDGFALVHYGFILKVTDNDLEKGIKYLSKGIATKQDGVTDGRFYFHLGDALIRLGRREDALKVFQDGVISGVFLSQYQRSLYNVDRLTARPWWSKQQLPQYKDFYSLLENNYKSIRDEALTLLNQKGYFQDESEKLRDVGDWKQFELYARGIKHKKNCNKCPITCKIMDTLPDVVGCKRGQIKFSVMHPGTHVWPHCGPTNCRLRIHLGLKVPKNTFIRVAEDTRTWEEGKLIIFDDSFEHEVWHNGSEVRLVLIIDIWHPELTITEKQSLSAI